MCKDMFYIFFQCDSVPQSAVCAAFSQYYGAVTPVRGSLSHLWLWVASGVACSSLSVIACLFSWIHPDNNNFVILLKLLTILLTKVLRCYFFLYLWFTAIWWFWMSWIFFFTTLQRNKGEYFLSHWPWMSIFEWSCDWALLPAFFS